METRPRSSYIGSHDIGVIVAARNARDGKETFPTYQTEGELWAVKRGLMPESDPNEPPLWWGRELEAVIFKRWLVEHPEERREDWRFGPVECPTIFHPEFPWLGATPDALRNCKVWGLDCKASDDWDSRFQWGEEGTDQIPLKLVVQGQWFMALTGAKRWRFVAKLAASNWKLREYSVEGNPALQDRLITIANEWWAKHMVAGEMPEDVEHNVIVARWPKGDGRMLEPNEETENLARHMRKATTRHKRAELVLNKAKNRLKTYIADADGIQGLATFKADKRGVRSLKAVGGSWE